MMNNHLKNINHAFREVAEGDWQKIRLFFNIIETGGVCSSLASFIYRADEEPKSIVTKDKYDENGDLSDWDEMDDLEAIWEGQSGTDKKWYCAEITIWPDGSIDFQPTSYEEPESVQKKHSLN